MEDVLRIKTLGSLEIGRNDRLLCHFASRKAEALLVYLACTPYPQPREVLADLLWDERTQSQAMANLRVLLSSLRREAGPFVHITRYSASIAPDAPVHVDLTELTVAVAHFRERQTSVAAQHLATALLQAGGEFMQGFALPEARRFDEWLLMQRERSRSLVSDGCLALCSWYLKCGEYEQAMMLANRLLELNPLSEIGYRRQMEALARAGRRTEALSRYQECCQQLQTELGLEPSTRTVDLATAIQKGELEPRHSVTPLIDRVSPYHLPIPATPLVGRRAEIADINALLAGPARVLTIVAPGGMGKTRLALEVAQGQIERFAHGVVFVDLGAVLSPHGIASALARSLGLTIGGSAAHEPDTQVIENLRQKALLLVLDSFEHLLEAAPLLTRIVEAAPRVKILVTSREVLRLHTEHVYPLYGLPFSSFETIDAAAKDDAVALFLQHARSRQPEFALQTEDLAPLRQLLQLVEGNPLAIILAAAWIPTMRLSEIAEETTRNLDFLEAGYRDLPPRQRSMCAIFDGTWAQLSSQEQRLFAALSVFHGGFMTDAARDIAGATPSDLLGLLHHSLLTHVNSGRFTIHELLRHFAAQKLRNMPEHDEAVRERHSVYYCRFVEQRHTALKDARADTAAAEISLEFENTITAAQWAADRQRVDLLEQIVPLSFYCVRENRRREGLALFERAVRSFQAETGYEHRVLGALITSRALFMDQPAVQPQEEHQVLKESLAHLAKAAALGEDVRVEEAWTLSILAQCLVSYDFKQALPSYERSLFLFQSLELPYEIACTCWLLAKWHLLDSNYVRALEYVNQAHQLWSDEGEQHFVHQAKIERGLITMRLGHPAQGLQDVREAITYFEETGKLHMIAEGYMALGEILISLGRFSEAQGVLSTSASYFARIGFEEELDRCRSLLECAALRQDRRV